MDILEKIENVLNEAKLKVGDEAKYLIWVDGKGYTKTQKGKIEKIEADFFIIDGKKIPKELIG